MGHIKRNIKKALARGNLLKPGREVIRYMGKIVSYFQKSKISNYNLKGECDLQ